MNIRKICRITGSLVSLVMLAGFVTVAAPAVALSAAHVQFATDQDQWISTSDADYIIRFYIDEELLEGDAITITFPSGTQVTDPGATILASAGWLGTDTGSPYYGDPIFSAAGGGGIWTAQPLDRTVSYTLAATEDIGEGAEIRIALTEGITNPPDINSYTLTVQTSRETTPVTSLSYAIMEPVPDPLPGIVRVYNPGGGLMDSFVGYQAIQSAIDITTEPGSVIELNHGTYQENPNVNVSGGIIIRNADPPDEVIIEGTWTFSVASDSELYTDTVLSGLTLRPANPGETVIDITGTADNIMITGCDISKAEVDLESQAVATTMIRIGGDAGIEHDTEISACSFNSDNGSVADIVIDAAAGPVMVFGNTFLLDGETFLANDIAIQGSGAGTITAIGNTFSSNGGPGIGYRSDSAFPTTVIIEDNLFSGLLQAVCENNGDAASYLFIKENVILDCTVPPGATEATATAAVDLDNCNYAVIRLNTITDNDGYAVLVGTDIGNVSLNGNTIARNAYGVSSLNIMGILDARYNYWGDMSGPTISWNPSGTGDAIVEPDTTHGSVIYTPWAGSPVTGLSVDNSIFAAGDTIDTSQSTGIVYTSDVAHNPISLMRYDGNPRASEPLAPALTDGYYGIDSPNAGGAITIKFYNDEIDCNTKVYYFNELQQTWRFCDTQGIAANQEYAYVQVGAIMSPIITELDDAVFVLVDQMTIPMPPTLISPEIGAVDVSVLPVFTWNAVFGAVRYEISVSDEPGFTLSIINTDTEFTSYPIPSEDALNYNTPYYWRVRAILEDSYDPDVPATNWSVGIFTTVFEPVACSGSQPQIEQPGIGAINVSTIPKFQWTEVPDAMYYTINVTDDPAFDTYIFSHDVTGALQYTADETQGERLDYDTVYYWTVSAYLPDTGYTASAVGIFTTASENSPVIPIDSIDFHGVRVGARLDLTSEITNSGIEPLIISGISRISGSDDFSYIGPATPFVIPVGETESLTFRYTPTEESPANAVFGINDGALIINVSGYGVISLLVGDVNGDGIVNVLDITQTARIILGLD